MAVKLEGRLFDAGGGRMCEEVSRAFVFIGIVLKVG